MALIETKRDDIRDLSGVHLFHNGMSNCSQRVRLALCEKGVSYESHHIDLQKHENLSPDFRMLNPNAVVPVLVHDGRTYIESNDIIAYIDEQFDGPPLWPVDPTHHKVTEELLARSAKLQSSLKLLTFEFLLKPIAKKGVADARRKQAVLRDKTRNQFVQDFSSPSGFTRQQITTEVGELTLALEHLESALGQTRWLNGPDFGLADISWLPNVHRAVAMKYPLDRFSKIAQWYRITSNRSCFKNSISRFEPNPALAFMGIYTGYRAIRGTAISAFIRDW